MILRSLLAFIAWCIALPAGALLTRADRDDAEYLELASRYATCASLDAGGNGVLIAPRWILTAAHRAKALQGARPAAKLQIDATPYEIESVHLHPEWKPGGPADIALVLLKEPVRDIEPTPIYREADEAGKPVVVVGHGGTGRIGHRPTADALADRRKRGAINTVDRVLARAVSLDIKAPEEASDLQGALAPGDGGAPAYVENARGLFVLGIATAPEDVNGNGIAGDVGDRDAFVRVSAFAAWIDSTMMDAAIAAAAATPAKARR